MEKSEKSNHIHGLLKFYNEAEQVCKETTKRYEFECPLCGGNAVAVKFSLNGHIHAACSKCSFQMIQ